jgi:RNA polymerase sigma-70 factor (ECF subfamily)
MAIAAIEIGKREAARAEKPAPFADIVREHQGMVFSIAYHFLRDRALAEELAQEVFLHLHKNLGSIHTAAHVIYWLRKVTTHRCIDLERRRKLRPRISLTGYLERAPEPASPEPEADPMRDRMLRRLVAALPERPRMIVILRFQEDLEPAEIAALLEIPLGTVKSNLHRALALLRAKMERERRGVAR